MADRVARLLDRLRGRMREIRVPEGERCSFCPQRAVVFEPPVAGGPTVGRCLDHPPESADTTSRCGCCGRTYWPDFLHLDCAPAEESSWWAEDASARLDINSLPPSAETQRSLDLIRRRVRRSV